MDVTSQESTETLNVLVNDGSSVGGSTHDLIVPPKSTSEILQLPTLELNRFLCDLRSGKVKYICVLVAEDEYVTDIWSAMVFMRMNELSAVHRWTKVPSMRRLGLRGMHLNPGSRSRQSVA